MSEPIKEGDLVLVIKPRLCCADSSGVGIVFQVTDISKGCVCHDCGDFYLGPVASVNGGESFCELPRLKRIPPLAELEGEQRVEKLTEPA